MDVKSIAKGAAAGTAVGVVCYALSSASSKKKHSIKKNAGKALRAAGTVLDEITSAIM
ncbi:MAG: hypothetical protein IJX77_02555 [Ruminococcus sp.]|nr:hypothetical protein [Ruminococcus sp.]